MGERDDSQTTSADIGKCRTWELRKQAKDDGNWDGRSDVCVPGFVIARANVTQ